MRVIFDTNVFISGIFWKGPPFDILLAFQKRKFQLFVSPDILEEYNRVLEELSPKYTSAFSGIGKILELVERYADLVLSPPLPKPICDDPDDDKFISAALAGKAECIVSGDKALLKIGAYQGISILTAKAFVVTML